MNEKIRQLQEDKTFYVNKLSIAESTLNDRIKVLEGKLANPEGQSAKTECYPNGTNLWKVSPFYITLSPLATVLFPLNSRKQ